MNLGWSIVIETTGGLVGMWTYWLGNGLKIFYPYGVTVPEEVIMETLNVTKAKPVTDDLFDERKWADFYSERLPTLGRVWIDKDRHDSYDYILPTITEDHKLVYHYFGHDHCNTIRTFEFTYCSETQPDAPTANKNYIQLYLYKFLELFVKVAKITGDITAININSGMILYTPEYLETVGCKLERWTNNYIEYCYTKLISYEVVLYSCDSLDPWITVLRRETGNNLSVEEIWTMLSSFDNSGGDLINIVPIIEVILKAMNE